MTAGLLLDAAPGTENTGMAVTVPRTTVRLGATLALLAFAQLIISIDYNIVYVALPRIGAGLGLPAHDLQWVVSAYAVAFGGFLLLGGRAADLVGRRRMFVFGLALYALSSVAGGAATSPWVLIAARAAQGIGGAFLFPATLSLVTTTFPEGRERNRALSVWAASGAGGMILGSLLGGILTEVFGWASVFFVNVPLAGGALLLAFRLIAPDPARRRGRFDLPGALTGTLGATGVVFALVQGHGWESLAGLGIGVTCLVAFVLIERRAPEPLMPPRLFANPNLRAGVAVTFLFMATFGTLLYFLTGYFQNVHHYSALATGLAFLPPMAAGFAGSMTGGRLATRYGIRTTLVTSLAIGAVGTMVTALAMSPDGSYLALLPGLLVLSVCQGVVFTTMFAAAATGVRAHEQGIASGVVSTGQQVGSAVGLAVLVAVADEPRTSVLVAAAGIAVTVVIASRIRATH
jgi:MFS family permease